MTKQITFTPYYILINNADFLIECQEGDRPADPVVKVRYRYKQFDYCTSYILYLIEMFSTILLLHTKVPPDECAALWPRTEHENKTLKAKVAGQPEKTAAFTYTDSHTTLLKLDNKVIIKHKTVTDSYV